MVLYFLTFNYSTFNKFDEFFMKTLIIFYKKFSNYEERCFINYFLENLFNYKDVDHLFFGKDISLK